jgi:TetR/AcrR family transcriptional regulator, cholesterol catabolism regulator
VYPDCNDPVGSVAMSNPAKEQSTRSQVVRRGDSEARRNEIIAIAARLFHRRGYRDVGMRDIALEANIKAASLYHHFASKDDLLRAVIFQATHDFIVRRAGIFNSTSSPTEYLAALLSAHLLHIWMHHEQSWVAIHELHRLPPHQVAEVQGHRIDYQRDVVKAIEAGVESGELSCEKPSFTALAILDMINGSVAWFRAEDRAQMDEAVELYLEMIITGVLGGVLRDRRR